ncbi:MAG TPA: hypothetical protein PLV59_02105 [Candidatus Dojkabacteria bacterium]|nr:hypothetical protein [Candidatus Dojkabacteria bacterium]
MKTRSEIKQLFSKVHDSPPKNSQYPMKAIKDNNGEYIYIEITSQKEMDLTHWIESSDWKGKESMFGVLPDYVDNAKATDSNGKLLYKKVNKKLKVESNNKVLEMEVVVTSIEENDKRLLHTLLMKTRGKK